METEDIQRMWYIDTKAQLGDFISEEEKKFFNDNYDLMFSEMESNFWHWSQYTSKFN